MKSLTIGYSKAIEACCALFRYGVFDEYRKILTTSGDLSGIKKIDQWKDHIDASVPDILLSDIKPYNPGWEKYAVCRHTARCRGGNRLI